MSVFGENDSCRLSSSWQTHIFGKFDHISRTYNQINYRNIWFAKVAIILIIMAQVLFWFFFLRKIPTLMLLSFLEAGDKVFLIPNPLLLLLKNYFYVSRSSNVISFEALVKSIMKVYKLEQIISQSVERKRKLFTEKWNIILQNL